MKVIVIIVSFNGSKWIDKCFSSLIKSTIPLRILVIDNASSDDTVIQIRNKFPEVEIIETSANLGFGKANNIGLKRALDENADYVFLLNQDTWIEKDMIEKLIRVAEENKEFGIVAPFQLSYDGTQIEKYFNDYVIGQYSPDYISDLYKKNSEPIYSSQFIHAAGWLISKNVIEDVGGFDPLFPHYGEDNDYVQRLQARKYLIGFVPGAILYHQGTNHGLVNPEKNAKLKMIFSIIRFKNPKGSMFGNTLVFFKSSFDAITSAILYRKLKALKMELKIFWKVFRQIGKISKSREIQNKKYAYLSL